MLLSDRLTRRIKHLIQSSARRLGYTLISNERAELLAQEVYLRRLLALLQIDCVLDVGANRGQYRDFLRRSVGYGGRIVSFEPIPEHAELLRERAAHDCLWTIENYALGAQSASAQLHVMQVSEFSSFLNPDHSKVQAFAAMNAVKKTIEVPVRRLDEVLPSLQIAATSRVYLKLDTQGFDLEVVKGATQTLESVLALQSEISVAPIYEGMPDYVTSIRTLESCGFRLAALFPVNPSRDVLQLVELDCHMVRADASPASAGTK